MRVRCSRGLRVSTFHGPMFVRSTDLLALPQVSSRKCSRYGPPQYSNVCCGAHLDVQRRHLPAAPRDVQ